jgi:hypothetical protein
MSMVELYAPIASGTFVGADGATYIVQGGKVSVSPTCVPALLAQGYKRASEDSRDVVRKKISGPVTLYVSTSGSDRADGSSAYPFRTIQRAVDEVCRNRDLTGAIDASVTIQLAAGTYTEAVWLGPIVGLYGDPTPRVTIQGDTTDKDSYIIKGASSTQCTVSCYSPGWQLKGVKVDATDQSSGKGVCFGGNAYMTLNHVSFKVPAGGKAIEGRGEGYLEMLGDFALEGSMANYIFAGWGATVYGGDSGALVLTGTPAVSNAFLRTRVGGKIDFYPNSGVTGTATGKRFDANHGGIIHVWGETANSFIPGNADGTTANGGVCA